MSDRNWILRHVRAAGQPGRGLLESCRGHVLEATEASRGLDCILSEALGLVPDGYWRSPDLGVRYEADILSGITGPDWTPPTLTGSVDEAKDLLSRKLPGALWAVGNMEAGPFCRLVYPVAGKGWGLAESVEQEGGAKTEPLAILTALLLALSQDETREGTSA